MTTFEVHNLDVWGNAVDGYDVNNSFRCGEVDIPDNADHAAIIRALKDAGLIRAGVRAAHLETEGDDLFIHISDARQPRLCKRDPSRVVHGWGRPVFNLFRKDRP